MGNSASVTKLSFPMAKDLVNQSINNARTKGILISESESVCLSKSIDDHRKYLWNNYIMDTAL